MEMTLTVIITEPASASEKGILFWMVSGEKRNTIPAPTQVDAPAKELNNNGNHQLSSSALSCAFMDMVLV